MGISIDFFKETIKVVFSRNSIKTLLFAIFVVYSLSLLQLYMANITIKAVFTILLYLFIAIMSTSLIVGQTIPTIIEVFNKQNIKRSVYFIASNLIIYGILYFVSIILLLSFIKNVSLSTTTYFTYINILLLVLITLIIIIIYLLVPFVFLSVLEEKIIESFKHSLTLSRTKEFLKGFIITIIFYLIVMLSTSTVFFKIELVSSSNVLQYFILLLDSITFVLTWTISILYLSKIIVEIKEKYNI